MKHLNMYLKLLTWHGSSSMASFVCLEKPRIVEGPKDVTTQEAGDVLFRCRTTGEPDVTVIWKKQDGQIPPGR